MNDMKAAVMAARDHASAPLRLIWIQPGTLEDMLSAATYLDTTRELRELGCRVTLVAPGIPGPRQIRGVDVLCLPQPDIYFFRQLIFHLHALRFVLAQRHQADIVLIREVSVIWLLPLLFLRLIGGFRPRIVADTRSVPMAVATRGNIRLQLRSAFFGLSNRLSNWWADGRTAITRRMADTVNIPQRKLWGVWPSGVNLALFATAAADRHWPDDTEPIELIYIGSMEPERNLLTFCRAVVAANMRGAGLRFRIIGDGEQRQQLADFARASEGWIEVLPPVPHAQVPALLAKAHVGVLPFPNELKFNVSSPVKLFEYMAAGLPILATKIDCHTDVLGNTECVFWAETADETGFVDALHAIARSRRSLNAMGALAAALAKAWTWCEAARKLLAALEYGLKRTVFTPAPVERQAAE